jgi:hypothetical protein
LTDRQPEDRFVGGILLSRMSRSRDDISPDGSIKDKDLPEYDDKYGEKGEKGDLENAGLDRTETLHEGEIRFKRLGWKKLTVCLYECCPFTLTSVQC